MYVVSAQVPRGDTGEMLVYQVSLDSTHVEDRLQAYRLRLLAVVAERAAVVQERVAAVPLPQIAALRFCNATVAATSETTVPQRLLHQELMSRPPRYP